MAEYTVTRKSQWTVTKAKPKERQPLKDVLLNAAVGMATGGLPKAILKGSGSAVNASQEMLDKGAYNAGGAVTDLASSLGASPNVAGGAGYATNVGIKSVPVVLGGMATGPLLTPALQSGGRRIMQSAIKPSLKDLKTGKAAKAIDTLLSKGINATPGGMEKLKSQIATLNDEIAQAIQNSSGTVNKAEVGKGLLQTWNKFQAQVAPDADLNAIRSAWMQFRNHPLLAGKTEIPVQLAQQMKQGTYKQLSSKYGEMGSAEVEAQKALARGLKDGIAKAVPSVRSLNAQESELLNALNITERRVMMGLNNNPGGLVWLANTPGKMASFIADKSALFKSLLARMMYAGEPAAKAVGQTGVVAADLMTRD